MAARNRLVEAIAQNDQRTKQKRAILGFYLSCPKAPMRSLSCFFFPIDLDPMWSGFSHDTSEIVQSFSLDTTWEISLYL